MFKFLRPALVLLAVFVVVGIAGVAYQGVQTLQRLTFVEADRDRWQRPADIIRALDVKDGNVVVDFGSGSGYFTLKLSDAVGPRGEVIAVDLRNLSLQFLRIRALLQGKRNIRIIVREPDDPHLPDVIADSVLILNTYHELSNPQTILRHISQALRRGGRLVIIDRSQAEHPLSPDMVEADLRQQGFELIGREDAFIKEPDADLWWLIVASKP